MRDLAGHFCLRVFHEVVDKLLLGESYSRSEAGLGLKALPPRSLSWRLVSWLQLHTGCWTGAWVLPSTLAVGLSGGQLEARQSASPERVMPKTEQPGQSHSAFERPSLQSCTCPLPQHSVLPKWVTECSPFSSRGDVDAPLTGRNTKELVDTCLKAPHRQQLEVGS